MHRLAVLGCALGILVGCNGEGTGPDDDNGDTVSAELDLATIDGTNLPFAINVTGDFRTEVMEGSLTLNADGTYERSTTTRLLDTSTGSSTSSTTDDAGIYMLDGETLTLDSDDPQQETISGTFSNNEATLQVGGRAWVYR